VKLGTNQANFTYQQFASPAGGDLRFEDQTGNELNYEIEQWNTNGISSVWVQVPLFSSNSVVTACWGNPAATNPPAYTTNGAVWNTNYLAVWHLNQANQTKYPDSTANANAAAPNNFGGTNQQSGVVAGSLSFNGVNQSLNVPSTAPLGLNGGQFTLSGWMNLNSSGQGVIIGKGQNGSAWYSWFLTVGNNPGVDQVNTANRLCVGLRTSNGSGDVLATQTSNVVLSNWVYAAGTYDGTNLILYVNGVSNSLTATTGTPFSNTTQLWLGADSGRDYLNGLLDELRVENTARSPHWVWATYQNIASNGVFNTYGTISTPLPLTPTNLVFGVSGNGLTLSWPANYAGWILQCQTDRLNLGLQAGSNAWFDVPGSSSVYSTNFPIIVTNPAVFYRLRHP
jgi:hypothetical protein